MNLEDLVEGGTYRFELHGREYEGVYQPYWDSRPDGTPILDADGNKTRVTGWSKVSQREVVEIQVPNPKGGAPLGFSVPLEDLVAV